MVATFVQWVEEGRPPGAKKSDHQWPREAILFHLRALADLAIWDGERFPSRYQLARETGLSADEIRTYLRNEQWWLSPQQLAGWSKVRPKKRTRKDGASNKPAEAEAGGAEASNKPAEAEAGGAEASNKPAEAEAGSAQASNKRAEAPRTRRPMKSREAWLERVLERYPDLQEIPREKLLEFIRRAVLSIKPQALEWQWRANTRPVLELLGLDTSQDLDQLLHDIELVARACRESNQPIFRRLVRGVDMPSPVDRSQRPFYVLRVEHWEERLAAARKWEHAKAAAAKAAPGEAPGKASPLPPPDLSEGLRVWDELMAVFDRHGWARWMQRRDDGGVLLSDDLMRHDQLADLLEMAADLEHGPAWAELPVRELLTLGVRVRFSHLYEPPASARDGP
jgi:hypothetical protein